MDINALEQVQVQQDALVRVLGRIVETTFGQAIGGIMQMPTEARLK